MSFKSSLLPIALLLMTAPQAQATVTHVTVGEGTSGSNRIPYCNWYWNSTTQSIYTAAEIGQGGTITSIAFQVSNAFLLDASVEVYLGHRSTSTFTSGADYAQPETLTKVYDGTLTLGQAAGWETLTLKTPFAYNGTDNLVVAVGRNSGDTNSKLLYAVSTKDNSTVLCRYGYGASYGNPTNTNYSYSTMNMRANIRLTFDSDVQIATSGSLTYLLNLNQREATVMGVAGEVPASLTIPSSISASGQTYSVTSIRDFAFADATSLTSVTLPANLASIGNHTFYHCRSLANISIPASVTEIGDFAFAYTCPTQVTLPSALTILGRGAFYQCKALTTINLPSGLTRLGSFAFKGCLKLQSAVVPAGVDSVEMHTFYGCSALTSIQLPDGLQRIGESAFQSCTKLAACQIPSSVTYIGQLAFAGCNALTSFDVPNGLQHLGRGAYQACTGLASVTIPAHIPAIPDRLFAGCSKLSSVTLQEGVTTIGREAFSGCALAEVKWPTTLRQIGYQAFRGSRHTMVPVIPRGVTEMEPDLYYEQTNVKSIYCYADVVAPEAVFGGLDLYNSTLYVKPSMLAAYRSSALGQLFGQILPLGDVHVDGTYDITDVTAYINGVNGKELPPFTNEHVILQDLDGDGLCNQSDLMTLGGNITQARQIPTYTPTYSAAPAFPETAAEEASTVLYDFDSFDHNTAMGLEMINQMRFEACIEGIRNPMGGALLTEADYVPMRWSTDLERYARVRAAESIYSQEHARLNDRSRLTITWNDVISNTENLAWAWPKETIQGSLEQYYREKEYWVHNESGVTGHYENIVSPHLRYVGVASVYNCACLGSSATDYSAKEHQFLDPETFGYIPLQVGTSRIDGKYVMARCRPNYTTSNFSLEINNRTRVALFSHFTTGSSAGAYLMASQGVTYQSSDASVATVDAQGFVYAHKVGTAVISGLMNGTQQATITVTVTCHHDYAYSEVTDGKVSLTCSLCGDAQEVTLPSKLTLYWGNSTVSNLSYYPLSQNPVGSYVTARVAESNGTAAYQVFLAECSNPELLDTSGELTYQGKWLVKGEGTVTVKVYCKYNPSLSKNLTIKLTPAVTE